MSEDQSADERAPRAKFELSLQQMEAMAAELVRAGHALFKDGELTDPAMRRIPSRSDCTPYGGTGRPGNIVRSCRMCNSIKGARPYELFVALFREFLGETEKRTARQPRTVFRRFTTYVMDNHRAALSLVLVAAHQSSQPS